MTTFTLQLIRRCDAPPDGIYAILADPATHLEWGGRHQSRLFRLTGLTAADESLRVGSRFSSTGRVFLFYPTLDRSTVTEASPGRALEFVTDNHYSRRCTGRYRNRYDLQPLDDGSTQVTYTFQRLAMARPPLHMRPPIRLAIQRFGAPRLFGRGLDNLVAAAEATHARTSTRTAGR